MAVWRHGSNSVSVQSSPRGIVCQLSNFDGQNSTCDKAPVPDVVDGKIFGAGQPCFGCGPDHPFGFRLQFVQADDEVVCQFTPGERYQGPPGVMHGGLVSTLVDEVGAWAPVMLLGKFVSARSPPSLTSSVRLKECVCYVSR